MGTNGSQRVEMPDVLIVGAGFAGLGAAIRLKRAGFDDFVVLERAADLGGTWRDNTYPGLSCDIPSHVYSYSFALRKHWTRGFAPGSEIKRYLDDTAERFGVTRRIRYREEAQEASWDDASGRWDVRTAEARYRPRFLIAATGGLSDPALPQIPGIDSFEGTSFHSANWDHEHDLSGESVAVIGTGASAIQFVPEIQPRVGRLQLFQRTAPWVLPRLDHEITPLEHRLLRLPFAEHVVRGALYWLMEARVIGFRRPDMMKRVELLARRHLRRHVSDPDLRRKLTPDYTLGCKRVLMSDNYYRALARPNVEVVTERIEEIRAHSVVTADGTDRPVDTIIYGTGFHVTDPSIARRVRGRDGLSLAERWQPSVHAFKGTTVSGFPNLFIITGPNTGLGHNSIVFIIESQLNYIVDCLRKMRATDADVVEVRPEAEERYNRRIQRLSEGTVWTAGNCQSWYLDDTGRNTTLWPTYSWAFRRMTRRFDPSAYVFRRGSVPRQSPVAA